MLPGVWPRSGYDLEAEDLIAVADRHELTRERDRTDVFATSVRGGVWSSIHHLGGAADMVAVLVGEHEVGDGRPIEADARQGCLDGVRATAHACIDDRSLAAASQDVGRDESEIDSLPRHAAVRPSAARRGSGSAGPLRRGSARTSPVAGASTRGR